MEKKELRLESFRFLSENNKKIRTKFDNICGKTSQLYVPDELFQKRTSRSNRVVIPWKSVKSNGLDHESLKLFKGGVVVEFTNEDYFNSDNYDNPTFINLKYLLGSDQIVSSIISFRSESGTSSSETQRFYFNILRNNYKLYYRNKEIILNDDNLNDYIVHKSNPGGTGNDKWNGFLFYSIKGGQQDLIKSHPNQNETLFNPAAEYADEETKIDIDLTMAFFAMHSLKIENISAYSQKKYHKLISEFRNHLSATKYNYSRFKGALLDYCENHPSLKMVRGSLYDPIQVEEILLADFGIDNKDDSRNIDFTHDEAVLHDRFYVDFDKNVILSPARPTNIFWSKHLSNMMQQNFSLNEFFEHQEKIVSRRAKLLSYHS